MFNAIQLPVIDLFSKIGFLPLELYRYCARRYKKISKQSFPHETALHDPPTEESTIVDFPTKKNGKNADRDNEPDLEQTIAQDNKPDFVESDSVINFRLRRAYEIEHTVFDCYLPLFLEEFLPKNIIRLCLRDHYPPLTPTSIIRMPRVAHSLVQCHHFDWIPENGFGNSTLDLKQTLAMNFLNIYGNIIRSEEREYILNMNKTYNSFYLILEKLPGEYFMLKDLLLGRLHRVKSRYIDFNEIACGKILFARISTFDEQTFFNNLFPIFFHPFFFTDKINLITQILLARNELENLTSNCLRKESALLFREAIGMILTHRELQTSRSKSSH